MKKSDKMGNNTSIDDEHVIGHGTLFIIHDQKSY